ncbi:MAG: COX15/CtaA family protein [Chitinophagales bacterium]
MRSVKTWLWIGLLMTLIQVLLGGITRLTGSGLSITEWEVLVGTLPPINEQQWNDAFDKYKQFPQFNLINQDMTLAGFKEIYFWEYWHRNWARLLGFVFIIPFIWFLVKRKLNRSWIIKLLLLLFLGGLQGFMGWVMVASGLIDKPWVSPYNLTIHLLLALTVFVYILWLIFQLREYQPQDDHPTVNKGIKWIIGLIALQIIYGGFMAGTKAGLTYTTYPLMNGKFFPDGFFLFHSFISNIFENHTAINFIHRTLAVIVVLIITIFSIKNLNYAGTTVRSGILMLLSLIFIQFALGIYTLLSGRTGEISITLGVLHQITAFFVMGACTFILYFSKNRSRT